MGRETVCTVRVDGDGAEAKTLLETEEVVIRSPHRLTIPFRSIESITVDGETLVLRTAQHTVEIEVGAKEAAAWAERIRNPKGRLDKLGVKAGQRVSVVGTIDDDAFAKELTDRGVEVTTGRAKTGSDLIFLGATKARDLDRLAKLRTSLQPAGAIWVIRPKGVAAITEAQVMEEGKRAGLVDTKVVKFSDTLTAEKLVIPVAQR
jgi:hypothetical protein